MYFLLVWYYEFEMDYRVRSLMCKTVPSKICQCHPYIHDQARVPCRFGSRVLIGVGDIFHRKVDTNGRIGLIWLKNNPISLPTEEDTFRWKLTPSGMFSVKSMYAHYLNDHTPFPYKYLWKLKVPFKIKISMWFVHRK